MSGGEQVGEFLTFTDEPTPALCERAEALMRRQAAEMGAVEVEIIGPQFHEFGIAGFAPGAEYEPCWTMAWRGRLP